MKSELDCYDMPNIVCPYCYNECEDDTYSIARNSDGDFISFTCENCNKEFKVLATTTITYTSARTDKDDNIVAEWYDAEEGDCKYGCNDCIFNCECYKYVCDNCIEGDQYDDENK